MAILNPYSKTTYVNGTAPDINAANLNKNEQGVYDVTEKVRELASYETNAAASAVSAASSASAALNSANSAAASAAVYTDLVEDVADLTTDLSNLTTVVANHAKWSTTEEVVIGTFDGKPLYRKGFTIASLPSSAGITNYNHGIANIDRFLNVNATMTDGTNFLSESSVVLSVEIYASKTQVKVSVTTNRSTYSAIAWLEYTKTTD